MGPTRFGPDARLEAAEQLALEPSRMIGTIWRTKAKITIDLTIRTSVLSSQASITAATACAGAISTGPVGSTPGGDEEDAAGRHAGAHDARWRAAGRRPRTARPRRRSRRRAGAASSDATAQALRAGGEEAQRRRVLDLGPAQSVGAGAEPQPVVRRGRLRERLGRELGGGQRGRRVAVLPAHAVAADLVEREAGVEGHGLGDQRGDHRRGRAAPVPAPSRSHSSHEHAPAGAHLAGVAERLAHALEAPVGVRDGALLLGVDLGGEDHVGVLVERLAAEAGEGDHASRRAPSSALGRVGVSSSSSAPRAESGSPGGGGVGQAGLERRGAAHLAQPAAVGLGRDLDQAGLGPVGDAERGGHREQRLAGLGAALAAEHALAPDHDHVAGVAKQRRRRRARRPRRGAAGRRRSCCAAGPG